MIKSDLTGERFGRLLVICREKVDKHGHTTWLCECDCGKFKVVSRCNLLSGNSTSCGCLHNELLVAKQTKHGDYGSRLYWIWNGMKARCFNEKDKRYKDYGGRGITVCEEWKSYENFRNWAISNGYSDDLTIDRIDIDGNYCPENCRWATIDQQSNNKRTNRYITFDGKTQTIKQWSSELGVNYFTLYSRIVKRGWDVERALTDWANDDG